MLMSTVIIVLRMLIKNLKKLTYFHSYPFSISNSSFLVFLECNVELSMRVNIKNGSIQNLQTILCQKAQPCLLMWACLSLNRNHQVGLHQSILYQPWPIYQHEYRALCFEEFFIPCYSNI